MLWNCDSEDRKSKTTGDECFTSIASFKLELSTKAFEVSDVDADEANTLILN